MWDTKMDKLLQEYKEDWSSMDQRLTRVEHEARQPRLAMEADGPAITKTRERTEGAATAVQAMHGNSFSTCRVGPGPKTKSTSFGMMVKPPDPSCREDVLVEDGAAPPKSCLPSLEMRSPTAAGGLLPTGEASTATKATFNKLRLRLYTTEETNSKARFYGLHFHPPGTTAASGNCLLPNPAGRLLKQNLEKLKRWVQAVLKVVSAPARFWERGARCFVVRLCLLERLDEAAAFFGGEWYRRVFYAVRIAVNLLAL